MHIIQFGTHVEIWQRGRNATNEILSTSFIPQSYASFLHSHKYVNLGQHPLGQGKTVLMKNGWGCVPPLGPQARTFTIVQQHVTGKVPATNVLGQPDQLLTQSRYCPLHRKTGNIKTITHIMIYHAHSYRTEMTYSAETPLRKQACRCQRRDPNWTR